MSTIKVTNVSHPSAASPAIVLDADGDATYAGVHDFSAATVTGAPQGLVLVTPTSIANSGGSASVSGGAVTLTGVTSVSLNGVFTSTYQNYSIVANITNSDATKVNFRLRLGGTDNTGNYRTAYAYTSSATGWTVNQINPDSYGQLGWATTVPSLIVANFANPQSASETQGSHTSSAAPGAPTVGMFLFSFRKDDSNQYDGITIYPLSGNSTGTIRVYGYQNS